MAWIRIPAKNGCRALFFPSSKFIAAQADTVEKPLTTALGTTNEIVPVTNIFLEGVPGDVTLTVGYSIEEVFSYFDKTKAPQT